MLMLNPYFFVPLAILRYKRDCTILMLNSFDHLVLYVLMVRRDRTMLMLNIYLQCFNNKSARGETVQC